MVSRRRQRGRIINVNIVSMTKISIGNPERKEERKTNMQLCDNNNSRNGKQRRDGRQHEKSFFDIAIFRGQTFRTRFQLFLCFLVILHRNTMGMTHQSVLGIILCATCTLSHLFGLRNVQSNGIRKE